MKTIFSFSLILFATVSFSQQNLKSVEADLKKQFQKIYYWDEHRKMDDTIDTYDSMQTANSYILDQILECDYNNPTFFNYPFNSLREYLDVISSKDRSLRIYSWDNYTGGTMHIV